MMNVEYEIIFKDEIWGEMPGSSLPVLTPEMSKSEIRDDHRFGLHSVGNELPSTLLPQVSMDEGGPD